MSAGDIETYYLAATGKWRNRVEGVEELPGAFDNQNDAAATGRHAARAREVQHIIRDRDGSIAETRPRRSAHRIGGEAPAARPVRERPTHDHRA